MRQDYMEALPKRSLIALNLAADNAHMSSRTAVSLKAPAARKRVGAHPQRASPRQGEIPPIARRKHGHKACPP